jgi:rubredoxin
MPSVCGKTHNCDTCRYTFVGRHTTVTHAGTRLWEDTQLWHMQVYVCGKTHNCDTCRYTFVGRHKTVTHAGTRLWEDTQLWHMQVHVCGKTHNCDTCRYTFAVTQFATKRNVLHCITKSRIFPHHILRFSEPRIWSLFSYGLPTWLFIWKVALSVYVAYRTTFLTSSIAITIKFASSLLGADVYLWFYAKFQFCKRATLSSCARYFGLSLYAHPPANSETSNRRLSATLTREAYAFNILFWCPRWSRLCMLFHTSTFHISSMRKKMCASLFKETAWVGKDVTTTLICVSLFS